MTRDPRRLALLLLALIGLAVAAIVTDPRFVPDIDRAVPYELLPPHVRFVLWGGCALVSVAVAVLGRGLTWGFVAAWLMPVERAVSHLYSWIAWWVPGVPSGDRLGWAHALAWGAGAALIMVTSGMVRPKDGPAAESTGGR